MTDRVMRPIYECPENCTYAQNQLTILRKNLHITILSLFAISKYSKLCENIPQRHGQTDGHTDRRHAIS